MRVRRATSQAEVGARDEFGDVDQGNPEPRGRTRLLARHPDREVCARDHLRLMATALKEALDPERAAASIRQVRELTRLGGVYETRRYPYVTISR